MCCWRCNMFDGVVEEVTVLQVLGDDNSKEGSCRASGGRGGVVGFGWFVESDFLDPDEIADVDTGDTFLCEFRKEWVVWREGGVKGFHVV